MRRSVKTSDGVLRQQQPKCKQIDHDKCATRPASETLWCAIKNRAQTATIVGDDEQYRDDNCDSCDVPPHTDVTKNLDHAHTKCVDQTVSNENREEDHIDVGGCQIETVVEHADEIADEDSQCIVDAGDHADLSHEVEPARKPRPLGSVATSEFCRPVIQTACSWIRRADLTHRHSDHQCKESDDDPTECDHDWTTGDHAQPIRRHATREDGNDRETDGEVAKPTKTAVQFLGVPKIVQVLTVGFGNRFLL